MNIREIAAHLVTHCRSGEFELAQRELYSLSAISTEPKGSPGLQSAAGLEAIIAKGKKFQAMLEAVHGIRVSEPVIAGDYFSISLHMEVTMKGYERQNIDEIAVYLVKGGRIASEEFFYTF